MIRRIEVGGETLCYELVQTQRRSIELRAAAQGAKVFAPRGVSLKVVDGFVRQRADWLRETQARLEDYRQAHLAQHPVTQGAPILVQGRMARLRLVEKGQAPAGLFGNQLTVALSPGQDPRQAVRALLIQMARQQIEQRLAYYIPLVGRAPGAVSIREQRTRWGSCSNLGNLNFNWKLIMAPPQALDYVVVHELCHLHELNHSRRFWDRVAAIQPDYADWVKWLKENGGMLGL